MQPIKQKSKGSKPLLLLSYEKIGPVGFEPTTKRLRVRCIQKRRITLNNIKQ